MWSQPKDIRLLPDVALQAFYILQTMKTSDKQREKDIYKVTIVGSIGNLLLLAFKFAAGILGQSAAMTADAIHSFSDFVTDVIVLFFVRLSGKPQDKGHNFGHGKYETLATALIGMILIAVGAGILLGSVENILRYLRGESLEAPEMVALVAAVTSILVKEFLYQYTVRAGRRVSSATVVANAWHHRSDAFSSIGTMVGIGGAILLGESWRILDPLAAAVVSLFIIRVAYQLIVPCAEELMEKSLPEEECRAIQEILLSFPEADSPHNMRTRRIGPRKAVNVHIRVDGNMTVYRSHEMTRKMEEKIRALLGPETFVNIHVEPVK